MIDVIQIVESEKNWIDVFADVFLPIILSLLSLGASVLIAWFMIQKERENMNQTFKKEQDRNIWNKKVESFKDIYKTVSNFMHYLEIYPLEFEKDRIQAKGVFNGVMKDFQQAMYYVRLFGTDEVIKIINTIEFKHISSLNKHLRGFYRGEISAQQFFTENVMPILGKINYELDRANVLIRKNLSMSLKDEKGYLDTSKEHWDKFFKEQEKTK